MNKKFAAGGIGFAVLFMGLVMSDAVQARDSGLTMVQMQTINNLNQQRAQLDSRIASAQSSGQLTGSQASDFRAQISQNASLQGQMLSDNFLSVAETQNLLSSLNSIETGMQTAINSYVNTQSLYAVSNTGFAATPASCVMPSANVPWRSNFNNWRQGQLQELQTLQNSVNSRIESGRVSGRLTSSEYSSLKREMDRFNSSLQKLANSNGRLTFSEKNTMLSRLQKIQDRVNQELRDRDSSFFTARRGWR